MKNSKLFKVWNILIVLLIFLSFYFIIHGYLYELTPEKQSNFNNYNFIITVFFVIDLITRLILFKKKYLKSSNFIIDFLACIDIVNPALKAARILRYSKIIRLFRLLRIFRFIKIFKTAGKNEEKNKLFNYLAIITLLYFILTGYLVSNYIYKKQYKMIETELQFLADHISYEIQLNDTFSTEKLKQLVYFRTIKNNDIISFSYYKNNKWIKTNLIPENKIDKNFFQNEIVKVTSTDNKLKFVFINKNILLYSRHIELLIILSSILLILIEFVIINIVNNKMDK